MEKRLVESLIHAGHVLVDQEEAEELVEPRSREKGFWFGGGDMAVAPDGAIWLVGRYRNSGDSRVGLEAGPRGAELAFMRSTDGGGSFTSEFSFFKEDLAPEGEKVLSIEGASLLIEEDQVRLFVSTEKEKSYPEEVSEYQKSGTGIWSIDELRAANIQGLMDAEPRPVLGSNTPCWLHVKDPVVRDIDGRMTMVYCSHPFSWASSNTGYAREAGDEWVNCSAHVLGRGPAWDVAIFRITECLKMPPVGMLSGREPVSMYFYDGGECLNDHNGSRPRGYSCEEIGGLAGGCEEEFPHMERLSVQEPLFVAPEGSGCSRYVTVCEYEDTYLVTWQQSQPDESQPLVINRVPRARIQKILGE